MLSTLRVAAAVLSCLLFSGAVSAPIHAQDSRPQPNSETTDFEKLAPLLAQLRARNVRDYAINTPEGIDDARFVTIGGIEQWITIRGEDRKNPVILFLHGGPGDATNPWGYAAFRSWLKLFTVVQWDQRGAGRTFGRMDPSMASTITIERMTEDGIELAERLRTSLGSDKLILVGHSWGSILGASMVKRRPDLFHAFVGTGQVANPAKNYQVAYAELLRHAINVHDERAIRELREVGPPPYRDGRGYGVQRKWSNLFEGADSFIASMFGMALTAPQYTLRDINEWIDGQGVSSERLVPQTEALTASALGGTYALPVFVIQGAEDFTTPTKLARELVDGLRAPRKAFVTIPGGGHFAVFMKSDLFLRELVRQVRPLAIRAPL